MRDRILNLLAAAGFEHIDTNRWGFMGRLGTVVRIGYRHNEWTVSYKDGDQPVRRWRLGTGTRDTVPDDLIRLITGPGTGLAAPGARWGALAEGSGAPLLYVSRRSLDRGIVSVALMGVRLWYRNYHTRGGTQCPFTRW